MFTHKDRKVLHEIRDEQKEIVHLLKLIYDLLRPMAATAGQIFQIGENMGTPAPGTITGTPLGGTSTFGIVFNGALQAGSVPQWSVTDPLISITPSADGMSVAVAAGAGDTNPSYVLTNTALSSDGVTTITTTATVPLLPAVTPPPTPATQGVITQLS
jgi:hypothetical protein